MSVRGFNTGTGIEQYDYDYLDNKPAAPTKASIGLENVDNTSDMDKPVSEAQAQALSNKVDKVPGMGLSQEDYTSAEKEKLGDLPTNAEFEAALEGKANQTEVTSLNQAINALDGVVNDTTTGLDTKAPAIINNASGAIASFADGADGMPVKKLVVSIEPVQGGSGDPSPDNVRPITGWTGAKVYDDPKYAYKLLKWNQIRRDSSITNSSEGVTTSYDAETHLVSIRNDSRTSNYSSGSTQITIANVVPVAGHRYALLGEEEPGVYVVAMRGGFLYQQGSVGSIFAVETEELSRFNLRLRSNYDFVTAHPIGDVYSFYLNIVDITEAFGEEVASQISYQEVREMFYKDWYPYNEGEETCVSDVNGDSYNQISVTFPSAAGTVYGGTITVYPDRTGALVVDRAIVDLGTLAWNYVSRSAFNLRSTNYIGAASPATTTTVPNAVSSVYPVFSYVGVSDMDKSLTIVFATSGQAGRVWVHDESFSNADTFKSAMSGVQLVYELATPVTYTLTESEISGILETLYGTNNIWADCGDTSVTYAADTKLYIEHLTQPTEDDMTADHAISAGTFFMIGNTLYLATSQIAAGATITPGTNATQLSLADALNQLNT